MLNLKRLKLGQILRADTTGFHRLGHIWNIYGYFIVKAIHELFTTQFYYWVAISEKLTIRWFKAFFK